MNSSLFSSKWLSLFMLGTIGLTLLGARYYGSTSHGVSADQIVPLTTKGIDAPLPSPPVPINGQAFCMSGIKLDERPANNQELSQVTITLNDKTTHASEITLSNASISRDGTLRVTVPGKQLNPTDTYRIQVKPLGYLENTYPNVLNIVKQCVPSTQSFRFGDMNSDNKITKADALLLTQAFQGNGNSVSNVVFQNSKPTLSDISRVIAQIKK